MSLLITESHAVTVSKILKWHDDPNSPYLCKGFYVEPLLVHHFETGTSVKSNRAEGLLSSTMHLYGNVKIQRNGKLVLSDKAHFYRDPKTRVLKKIELEKNVSIQKPGQWLAGDYAILWRDLDKGYINNGWYRFAREDNSEVVGQERRWYGLTSWGHAKKIEQLGKDKYRMHDATYAACPPGKNIWLLEAKRLDIDKVQNEAYGYDTVLKVRDVPVLYWPYFSYPIDKRRKSGFLMPSYTATRQSGNDVSVPYYFNLAPNYDATVIPHYLSLRGYLFETEERYLGQNSVANLNFSFMNHDSKFGKFQNKAKREGTTIHSLGSQRIGGRLYYHQDITRHWQMGLDYNNVSDDYFYRDLSSNLTSGTQQHLLQRINWQYLNSDSDSSVQFNTTFQQYKTLHPYDQAAVLDQYSLLPQIDYKYKQKMNVFEFDVHSQVTNFKWPGRSFVNKVDGERYVLDPAISFPMKPEYGFFIPTIHEHVVYYSLRGADKYLASNLQPVPDHREINIPYFTFDTGLYFDKSWSPRYSQTVTPRLFYVNIPNKDQSTVPLFDSGLNNFSNSYLYEPNRFSGLDRLGDSHHMTYALTTEFNDLLMSRTFMSMGIGQIHYFKDRKQTFCYGRGCTGKQYLSPNAKLSPIIVDYHFSWGDKFSTNMSYAWSHQPRFATADLNYSGKYNHLYKLSYNYAQSNLSVDENGNYIFQKLENIQAATSMPLTRNWHGLGSWGYNLTDDHAHTYFLGAEYESCCWAFRVLGGQKLLYLDKEKKAHFDKMIYVQFLIKGLSSFGSSPKTLITSALPGYEDQYSKRFTL